MPGEVRVNGSYKGVAAVSTKVNGAWKDVAEAYTKVNGTWRQWFASGGINYFGLFSSGQLTHAAVMADDSVKAVFTGSGKNGISVFDINVTPALSGGFTQTNTFPNGLQNANQVKIGSNGDLYISGTAFLNGGFSYSSLSKWSSTGSHLWSRYLNSNNQNSYGVDVNSSDVIAFSDAVNGRTGFKKVNSSGTIQWARQLNSSQPSGVAIDNLGNIYGSAEDSSNIRIVKFDTNGNTVWSKSRAISATRFAQGAVLDSNNNFYVVFDYNLSGYGIHIAKFNTSGTFLWERRLTAPNQTPRRPTVNIDQDDNLYVSFNNFISGENNNAEIVKLDSNGNLLFSRTLRKSGDNSEGNLFNGVYPDSNSRTMLVSFDFNFGSVALFKLPLDGSKTGTYSTGGQTVIYETNSWSVSSQSSNAWVSGITPITGSTSFTSYSNGSTSTIDTTSFTTIS